ncbi:CAP domain-containing protein [Litchfieldia salsa]|uniref:Uncharacterized conserved protein YkwD, contains CAP (CSP/antigen 5/PR1) domain n=1 Tax=Litchfieldia salsa TaxID=930152 RepID=A0A1H0RGI1_9BACI|nr:CAP domain-containing protein [Litchfieldia salsa]SDP28657.1 Uncharacterized conserved protein YkwD, contains CAP (CSP/antigen 5/PR1) domain [Litchfieldia salsa]
MRTSNIIIIFLVIVSIILIYAKSINTEKVTVDEESHFLSQELDKQLEIENSFETEDNIFKQQPKEGLISYIGLNADEVEGLLGKPVRVDRSSYDYDWWIYNENSEEYLQVGIANEKVVTIFAIGKKLETQPFQIDETVEAIKEKVSFSNKVSFISQNNSYRFELNETEMSKMPLLKMGEVFVQLYFDTFTNKLSSIRYMDSDTLVKQRPYELIYRGELLTTEDLSKEEWEEVEKGNAAQILDITNVIRLRHGLEIVKWDESTSTVAYNHSKDMNQNEYFSHTSPTFGGLADRLAKGEIIYQLAGENIAAMYVDGIAAVEGWLNSEGHRETLLNEEFTHLGVGVFEKHYTQNFVRKWE